MKENKSNPLLYLLKGKVIRVIKHLVIVTEHTHNNESLLTNEW